MVPSSSCKRNFEFTKRSWAGGHESFQRFLKISMNCWFVSVRVMEWGNSGTVLQFRKVTRCVPWRLRTTLSCWIVYMEKSELSYNNQFSWFFPICKAYSPRLKLRHPTTRTFLCMVHFGYDQLYDQKIAFYPIYIRL